MSRCLVFMIRVYQVALSGWLGPCCRFYPNCSSYAIEAIRRHGAFRGAWLSIRRVAKCHPLHPGGVDLVPTNGVAQAGTYE